MPPRTLRLVVIPALLLLSVSGLTFGLAQLAPAKSEAEPSRQVLLDSSNSNPLRGEALFAERCATCHGERGEGGGVGPRLVDRDVSIGEARATIETGSGVMPADLVEGQDLDDVLSYLRAIIAG
jgi:mono/diheme cytochrome c family protein